jgi:hypothetical protein
MRRGLMTRVEEKYGRVALVAAILRAAWYIETKPLCELNWHSLPRCSTFRTRYLENPDVCFRVPFQFYPYLLPPAPSVHRGVDYHSKIHLGLGSS